jgi:hypothetical protein
MARSPPPIDDANQMIGSNELPFALDNPMFVIANMIRLVGVTWVATKAQPNCLRRPVLQAAP